MPTLSTHGVVAGSRETWFAMEQNTVTGLAWYVLHGMCYRCLCMQSNVRSTSVTCLRPFACSARACGGMP